MLGEVVTTLLTMVLMNFSLRNGLQRVHDKLVGVSGYLHAERSTQE